MPNITETSISGKSYTNKDFNSIYSELLDLVKVLTTKWDPSTSNESDPGVVLLKLDAITADKNNYNIDKNVLENFPLSVTQYGNARKIYDIAGYSMHWYKSAQTKVSFTYAGDGLNNGGSFKIPRLQTMVTDDSGEIVYTLVSTVVIDKPNKTVAGDCLQGVIKDYEVNGVTTVTLDNLDSNFRLYFTEQMVAENGIFIANADGSTTNFDKVEEWSRVENLETQPLNSKIYKFGVLPNTDTCYIQFPQDIANLIGSGLNIKYLVSSGESGNIGANVLNTLYSDLTVRLGEEDLTVNDDMVITNVSSTADGEDPESLIDAYNNYKRTVGTFNTLVTCKDYETAIFNSYSEDPSTGLQQLLTSNVVVSDRTNDISRTTYVVTLSSSGAKKNLVKSEEMDAFDLGIYSLSPMKNIYNNYYYNKSFSATSVVDATNIETALESGYKSVQHDFIDTHAVGSGKYIYKNFYKLIGVVSTYYKVSRAEAADIESNIKTALYKALNARKVIFGESVDYDKLVEIIQNSDSRIKYVNLNQPEYQLKYITSADNLGTYDSASELSEDNKVELLSKMITAGNVQLFDFDKNFNYEFGQTGTNSYLNIQSISTNSEILSESVGSDNGYTVQENENIQLYSTSLVSKISYTTYVNYNWSGSKVDDGTQYVIQQGDSLKINYTDTNNTVQNKTYGPGTIIKPVGVSLTETTDGVITKPDEDGNSTNFDTLGANQSIDILEKNDTSLAVGTECLWFTNDSTVGESGERTYYLFRSNVTERILENNEYFIYTSPDRNELVILSSGTKISRAPDNATEDLGFTNQLNASDIISDGQSAVSQNDWYSLKEPLTASELIIVTLGEGAILQGAVEKDIDSIPQQIFGKYDKDTKVYSGAPRYKSDSDSSWIALTESSKELMDMGIGEWYVFSRLNLNLSSDTPQELNQSQSVTIKIKTEDGDAGETSITGPISILANSNLTLSGGTSVDTSVLTEDGDVEYSLGLYSYTPKSTESRDEEGYLNYPWNTTDLSLSFDFKGGFTYMIPILKSGSTNTTMTVSNAVEFTGQNLSDTTSSETTAPLEGVGTFFILVKPEAEATISELTFSWSGSGGTEDLVKIGQIYKIGYTSNNLFSKQVTDTLSSIGDITTLQQDLMVEIAKVKTSDGYTFDWVYEIDPLDEIDTSVLDTDSGSNVLDARAVWSVNHICNKFTIAQLNTKSSSITVAASSKM